MTAKSRWHRGQNSSGTHDNGQTVDSMGAYTPEDTMELVNVRVAREQRVACDHLGEDTAEGPDVHRSGVVPHAKKNLGRAIPQGHDFVCVGAYRDAKRARQSKVRQLRVGKIETTAQGRQQVLVAHFDRSLVVNEEILRLEITMENTTRMTEVNTSQQLLQVGLYKPRRHIAR